MAYPQLDHRVKLSVIALAVLLLAGVAGYCIGTDDYWPLIVATLAVGLLLVWFATGEMFWIITVASSYLAGTFPILGGSFNTFQILMAVGVAKYLISM